MNPEKKNKIAIFIADYSLGNSPSLLNLLFCLSKKYFIDLYLKNVSLINREIKTNEKICCINVTGRINYYWEKITKKLFNRNIYQFLISVDPQGFFLCGNLFPHAKPFYYSLELYLLDDHYGLIYPQKVKIFERKNIHLIRGLIIQSHEKETIFKMDYALSQNIPTFILPVTGQGPSNNQKSDYLRDLYKIPKKNKIAIHLGGIAEWFSCLEICEEFAKIPHWTLFFQGYPQKNYILRMNDYIKLNKINNIIISDCLYDSINELEKIIQSCDVGIAWYNDISTGFRTIGSSSGKIATYLKYGLPIIATRYDSTITAIEKTKCGICISDIYEIKTGIECIIKDYSLYSKNALIEYETTYRFEKYEKDLLQFLNH